MPDFGQTQTTQIPSAVQEHYDRNLLEHSQSALVHGLFAQKKKITESTDTIKFRKYALLPKATIPLVEGVNPTPHRLAREDITARVSTYGAYVEVTDEVEILNVDPILTVASDRTGRQAGETLDELVKNVINAGANVMWAGGVASRNNIVSGVTVEDFRKINRAMQNLNSPYFYEHIKAGTGQGTQPIKPSYLCITHPDVIYDLEQLTGWVPVSQYGNAAAIHDYEVANALKADCILIANGHQNRDAIMKCGVPVLDDIIQVLDYV